MPAPDRVISSSPLSSSVSAIIGLCIGAVIATAVFVCWRYNIAHRAKHQQGASADGDGNGRHALGMSDIRPVQLVDQE